MPLPSSTSSSSLTSLGSGVSKARVTSSSSSSEQHVTFSERTPTAVPMSMVESPDGPFERTLDEQGKRMLKAIGNTEKLSERNKKALADYKELSEDVFLPDDTAAKDLLKSLGITLINEFDNKAAIEAILKGNIQSTNKVNKIQPKSRNEIKNYLGGRSKAAATLLLPKNPSRVTPEEFVEKINQAAIEARFLQLESRLTENDPNDPLTPDDREKAIYEIILLVTAIKNYSSEFSSWYNKPENKTKFERVARAMVIGGISGTVKNRANDKKNMASERIDILKSEVEKLQSELEQARCAYEKEQERVKQLERQGKKQQQQLQQKVKALENELPLIKKELADARATIEQKEKAIEDLQTQISKLTTNLHEQEGQRTLEANNSFDEKQALERSIAEKESHLEKLTADLTASKHENANLRESFEGQKIADSAKILALEGEKRKLQEELSTAKDSHTQATAEIKALKKEVAEVNSELKSKEEQVRDLQGQISLLENQVRAFESEKRDHQQEKNKLNAKISELQEKLNGSELKDMLIKEKDRFIEKSEKELEELKRKLSEFEEKERGFHEKKTQLDRQISKLESEVRSSAENATIVKSLTHELRGLTVKVSEFETKETTYKEKQQSLQLRISELEEAYEYLQLTIFFADAFTLPSNAIKAVEKLHQFIEKYSAQKAHILLEKVFGQIARLMKDFPSAGPEFTKISIHMLYDLVEKNEMKSLQALHLLLSISPAMTDFLDRAPITQYLNVLGFLVKCEGTSEEQQEKQKLIIETLDKRKADYDLYKVLKQTLKQGHKKDLEVPFELREALIEFQLKELVPKDRELFKFIKALEKDFPRDPDYKVFPGEFSIKSNYIKRVEQLENADTSKTSTIQRNGTLSRNLGLRGSIRITDPKFATTSFFRTAEQTPKASEMVTRTDSLRRKAYPSRVRSPLTDDTFTRPTDQDLDSSNSNGVRMGLNK